MVQPVRKRATYEDLDAFPEGQTVHLIDGELRIETARPAQPHLRVEKRLSNRLKGFDDPDDGEPGGWLILIEPEIRMNGDAVAPDLAGWRLERVTWPDDVRFFTVAPDWGCEVISPSTEVFDRGTKLPALGRFGVPWAWVLDPEDRTLEIFRHDEEQHVFRPVGTRYQGSVKARVPPFDAIELDIGRLWG